MVSNTSIVQVYNMTDQIVVYKIDEDNIRRRFSAHETKNVTAGELRKLYYITGGRILLQDYLCVQNKELAKEFGVPDDMIEYYWTKEDIDNVLLTGELAELEDALEFGPEGIREAIRDRAVELKINDLSKRKAIDDFMNININAMIANSEAEENKEAPKPSRRRVQRARE